MYYVSTAVLYLEFFFHFDNCVSNPVVVVIHINETKPSKPTLLILVYIKQNHNISTTRLDLVHGDNKH
jgi:hypothetical protein